MAQKKAMKQHKALYQNARAVADKLVSENWMNIIAEATDQIKTASFTMEVMFAADIDPEEKAVLNVMKKS